MRGCTTCSHGKNTLSLLFADAQLLFQFFSRKLKLIVINKAIRTSVVRRININALHLSRIRLHQMLKRIEIVAADVNILTVLVFRLFVVLSVRHKHRGGVH